MVYYMCPFVWDRRTPKNVSLCPLVSDSLQKAVPSLGAGCPLVSDSRGPRFGQGPGAIILVARAAACCRALAVPAA
jgi:hypothetical protein